MSNIWNTILKKRNSVEEDENVPLLSLDEFSKRNLALQIYSELLDENIWFCSNDEMAKQINRDIPDAVCYTVDELKHLLNLNPTAEDIKKLHLLKEGFKNSKIIESKYNGIK